MSDNATAIIIAMIGGLAAAVPAVIAAVVLVHVKRIEPKIEAIDNAVNKQPIGSDTLSKRMDTTLDEVSELTDQEAARVIERGEEDEDQLQRGQGGDTNASIHEGEGGHRHEGRDAGGSRPT